MYLNAAIATDKSNPHGQNLTACKALFSELFDAGLSVSFFSSEDIAREFTEFMLFKPSEHFTTMSMWWDWPSDERTIALLFCHEMCND